jgi:outer membrane protein assembly factor BamB
MMQLWALLLLGLAAPLWAEDWPEWRGVRRDGTSTEKNLPAKWSLSGENLLWKAPYGARSSPVVFGNRVFLQNGAGKGESLQERLVCLDADTGKLLWEQRWNLYMSDVPPHRIAWSAPAIDPETAYVYAFGGNGTLSAFTRDGKLVWRRSLAEDYGLFTTHGGRTSSPLVDGDLVIVSAIASTWGTQANRSHRLLAFDKRTGETVWVSTPGGRPYDTAYSNPIITKIGETRLLIQGLGDGSVVAVKPQTGEPVWRYEMAKRGINSPVVMVGKYAIVSHSEENLDVNVLGMVAAIDASAKGKLGPEQVKWADKGFEAGFSGPLTDGDTVYLIDNTANLAAFDAQTGHELWKKRVGSIMKSSPVWADGKIYVGTESGKFFILKPNRDGADILSEVELPPSQVGLYSAGTPEPVLAGAAVSNGRVYFASVDNLYCLGRKTPAGAPAKLEPLPKGDGPVAWIQVRPAEVMVTPGQSIQFRALAFDAEGRFLREEKAEWSAGTLKGTVQDGKFTAASANVGQAGIVKATVGGVAGEARVRVARSLPWTEDFESFAVGAVPPDWVSAVAGKYTVQELDGQKVLAKAPDETLFARMRVFFGPDDLHDYTVQADIRLPERRRQIGDAGIFTQRYYLVLFGNNEKLELNSWQPETQRRTEVAFKASKDTWYTLKLRAENLPNGQVRLRGKIWPRDGQESDQWMIEKVDAIGNREGSPGLFGDAKYGVFYDNFKVTANQ